MQDNEALDLFDEEGKYKWFTRTEPRQADGPVKVDDKTGFRYQYWSIGMVRNAKEENRDRVKVFLDPIPHIIIPKAKPLQGWYKAKFEPKGVRPRPCMTESVLTEPYGGYCAVGCGFCYINSGQRGYRATGLTTVPQDYGDQVREQLRKWRTSAAGYICSFIDPFLPLEGIYHNSQGCAEAFHAEGLPVYFLSRLLYPDWSYDLLRKNKYSYAQMSINTNDPNDWRKLSPKAAALKELFEQIRELHKNKIYISIQCNPIVAGVTSNEDIVKLIYKLADCGADHVIFKFVEAAYSWKGALVDKMTKQFGAERGESFRKLLTCNIGGQVTIQEEYRLDALNLFRKHCKKAGITMATCYEYEYERDKKGNIVNSTGVSVGPKYLTADQCHGHRVPMFTREHPDSKFTEVEECPPSGCLHCGDDNNGIGSCGSLLFSQAGALRSTDYRVPVHHSKTLTQIQKYAPRTEASDLVQIKL